MNAKQLIDEAISLPVEEKAIVVDSILGSMNPSESDIEDMWVGVAGTRLEQLRSGEVVSVPGEEVFRKI